MPNTSSQFACRSLEQLIKLVHCPTRIISDRGKAFDCAEFQEFCKKHKIKHIKNAIASPRSNGQAERTNRTILEALAASIEGEHDKWDRYVLQVQKGINNTINATTGIAPGELLYGVRPRVENEVRLSTETTKDSTSLRRKAKTRCDETSVKMRLRFNKNKLPPRQFKENDIVLVERTMLVRGLTSGKLVPRYIGPVKIVEVLGNDRYRVISFSKDRRRFKGVVSSERLKVFKPQVVTD